MKFIYILLLILPTVISANQDSSLTEGYFVAASSSDSVQVKSSGDRLTLTMKNGSNINFDLSDGKFQHQNIFEDAHLELIIKNSERFESIDRETSEVVVFSSVRRHRRHCFRIRFTWIATECRQATVPDRLPSIRSCKREINPFTPIMI